MFKKSKIPIYSSQKAGLPPGTPVFTGNRKIKNVKITLMDYDKKNLKVKAISHIKECIPYLNKKSVTWININGLHEVDIIKELGTIASIHPLIIEDILHTQQRPKMEVYDECIFMVLKLNLGDDDPENIVFEQISIILGKNYVISFLEKEDKIFEQVMYRIKNNEGRIRSSGSDYLAYRLLDVIIDKYFGLLENLGDKMEELELELVENPEKGTLHKIHTFKRELVFLRKSTWPLREMIRGLERDDLFLIKKSTRIYLMDLYDHTIQIIDSVDTFRDLIGGMLDVYLSSISVRMNEIMKVLTLFAAIFIPLTLIAGIYGMNFRSEVSPFNMPELSWFYGYPFAIGLMLTVSIILLGIFKRKKWF